MGLDQYAYRAAKAGQRDEFWDSQYNKSSDAPLVTEPLELAYWRKHPNLHGWMERLYRDRGGKGDFNGDEIELTWADIDLLEKDVRAGRLPPTQGFFFGSNSDEHYRETDLEFCRRAKADLFMGLRVFYNSSW